MPRQHRPRKTVAPRASRQRTHPTRSYFDPVGRGTETVILRSDPLLSAPAVAAATRTSTTTVTVAFTSAVDETSALNPNNYSVTGVSLSGVTRTRPPRHWPGWLARLSEPRSSSTTTVARSEPMIRAASLPH